MKIKGVAMANFVKDNTEKMKVMSGAGMVGAVGTSIVLGTIGAPMILPCSIVAGVVTATSSIREDTVSHKIGKGVVSCAELGISTLQEANAKVRKIKVNNTNIEVKGDFVTVANDNCESHVPFPDNIKIEDWDHVRLVGNRLFFPDRITYFDLKTMDFHRKVVPCSVTGTVVTDMKDSPTFVGIVEETVKNTQSALRRGSRYIREQDKVWGFSHLIKQTGSDVYNRVVGPKADQK